MIKLTVMTRVSEVRQRTRLYLRDRCGSTERPLITHEEKTHTHDTVPAKPSQLI